MVKLRTAELHQKVRELEGRDIVQQYLLKVHSTDEFLNTLLTVVVDVCRVDCAAYFTVNDGDEIERLALQTMTEGADIGGDAVFARIKSCLSLLNRDGDSWDGLIQIFQEGDNVYGVAPVATESKFFGVLVVSRHGSTLISESEMSTVAGFAAQGAIGINDCHVQEQFSDIQTSLDDVLNCFADSDKAKL